MTDEEIATFIKNLVRNRRSECASSVIAVNREMRLRLVSSDTSLTAFKKHGEVAIEIGELPTDNADAIALLALRVGKRIERFERGLKANAGRTSSQRQKIAQNAIQTRWNAS